MKRNNILAKKRLMKTTTILMTLLIAVALVSSTAVTAFTSNVNEDIEFVVTRDSETGTLDAPDDSRLESHPVLEPEIMTAKEEPKYYEGFYRGGVLWDNNMTYSFGAASQNEPASGVGAEAADDFHFEDDTAIADVHWVGTYWNGANADTRTDWKITFYEDGGGEPGAVFAGPFDISANDIKFDLLVAGATSWRYEMSCFIPLTVFTGGDTYWISIRGFMNFPPQSGWGMHEDPPVPINGSCAKFRSEWFGFPTWVDAHVVFGPPPVDACFQLTYSPEHDVAPTEIKTPESGGMECGCLPVEVTVENYGSSDEFGVDVNVEIRHYQWCDGFEEGEPFWDISYGSECCHWQYVTGETAFPGVVTPHSGDFMLELDQVGCTSGYASAMTLYPDDFSCKCDPRLSFYMWHDEYGSDDYVEVWLFDTVTWDWFYVGGPYYRNDCEPGCPAGWQEHIINLSAFAHYPNPLLVEFAGMCGMPTDSYNLHIDDVCVYDLEFAECTEIDIPAGEEMQVEYSCWTPCKWQVIKNEYWDYTVIVETKLDETCTDPKDQVPGNNVLTKDITLLFPCFHDIGGYSIISPPPCGDPVDVQTFDMIGTIKNFGQFDECCFDAYMRVYEVVGTDVLFFDDFEDDSDFTWPPTSSCGDWTAQDPTNWNIQSWSTCDWSGWNSLEMNDFPRRYDVDDFIFTCMIDTTGYPCLDIEYVDYLSYYGGLGGCTLSIECSSDGVNWQVIDQWVNPEDGWDCIDRAYQTCLCTGGDFYLGFRFVGPDTWEINGWEIDNLKISGITFGDILWEEHICVDDLPVCTELELDFGEWTPEPPDPCFCGVHKYVVGIEADMCSYDQTPENNLFTKCVEVRFQHDVGIEAFTEPCNTPVAGGGPVLFSQLPDWWSAYTSHEGYGYKCYDDFELDFDPHEIPGYERIFDVHWWGIAGIFEECSGWTPCDCSDLEFDIGFYKDNGGVPGDMICYYEDVAYTVTVIEDGWTTDWDACYYETDLDPGCVIEDPVGWISIQSQGSGPCAFLWVTSDWGSAYQEGADPPEILDDLAFNLTGSEEAMPPNLDCMIQCGEDDLCVMVHNYGTYVEDCTVYYELYIWDETIPDLVLVADGSVTDVILDPGESEEVCFDPYEFEVDAIYYLWCWIDPELGEYHDDCMPCNNYDGIGIGVDCCAPESCHELSPIEPDGENNWYVSDVTVHLYAWDPCELPSGVKEIVYILNGVENSISGDDGTFTLSDDGVHHVEFYAVDNVGHEEAIHHAFEVAIDTTKPSVDLTYVSYEDDSGNWMVDLTALAGDATSGMDKVEFYIGTALKETVTGAGPYQWTYTWEESSEGKTFMAKAYDNAGNDASDSTDIESVTMSAQTTQTISQSLPVSVNRVVVLSR